ncbi:hypothetical protein Y888_19790 [Mixta calida B021323]|nr:hypothetical protein Y888_19790 [Mixta calida B021323]
MAKSRAAPALQDKKWIIFSMKALPADGRANGAFSGVNHCKTGK